MTGEEDRTQRWLNELGTEFGTDSQRVYIVPSERHAGAEAMFIEVNPKSHDLIERLREKLGVDPVLFIKQSNHGIGRERKALMFIVEFSDAADETIDSLDSLKEDHQIDKTVNCAFQVLMSIGVIDENMVPTCEGSPLEYCLKEYGRHSLFWYCAKIGTIALHCNQCRDEVEAGETPVERAIFLAEQLGAWCGEFNFRFEHEESALRGADIIKAAKEGGEETRKKTRRRMRPRLEEMKELVPKHGIANAARILATKGMGSFAANKKLWQRRQKK